MVLSISPTTGKKSISSPDKVDSNGMKKLKADSDSVLTFISEDP
jgi:hypothetical protein